MFLPFHLWFAAVAFGNGWGRRAYLPIGVAAGIIALSAAFCALELGDIELTMFPSLIVEIVLVHVLAVMMEIPPSAFGSAPDVSSGSTDGEATTS